MTSSAIAARRLLRPSVPRPLVANHWGRAHGLAWLAGVALLAFTAPGLGAQAAPPVRPPSVPPAAGAPDPHEGEEGARSGTDLSSVTVRLGGYIQADGRWILGARAASADGLLLRRARLVVDAAMPSGWHLRLQPDFGQGRVQIQDAFVGRDVGPATVRVGRFRPAYGTERMQSSSTLLSPERGITNSLMPSRSFGAQLQVRHDALHLALGAYRTPVGTDAVAIDTDGDVEGGPGIGWDVGTRVAYHRRSGTQDLFELQGSVLAGREEGTPDAPALIRLSSPTQQPLLLFARDDAPTLASGGRVRTAIGALWLRRGWLVSAEGAAWQQRVRRDVTTRVVGAQAASARAAYLFGGTRRRTLDVDPAPRGRGALELGVRAGTLSATGAHLREVVAPGSIGAASHGGVALSWIPTTLTRVTFAYDYTWGTALTGPSRLREHGLQMRWQQGF